MYEELTMTKNKYLNKRMFTARKNILIIISFFIFHSSLVNGEIRYVSKTGASIPPYTSWATAADSIQKCINICQSGDTIYVANGFYTEDVRMIQGISLIGIDWDSTYVRTIYGNDNCSILGFTTDLIKIFKDTSWYTTSNVVIRHNKVIGMGVNTFNLLNSLVADNVIISSKGIWFENYCNSLAKNNLINSLDAGIDSYDNSLSGPHTSPTLINNVIFTTNHGIMGYRSQECKIFNNLVLTDSAYPAHGGWDWGPGGIFSYYGDSIVNNVINGPFASGIQHWNIGRIINNSFSKNRNGFYYFDIPQIFSYNNLWNNTRNFYSWTTNFIPDSTNKFVDPMFVNEDSLDFHLQMYSPLIDAGDPNILDRDGSRSDIGLFGGPYGEKYTYRDLAPKPPKNLTAQMESKFVRLRWNKNTEADFSNYRIYRDTVPNFIYDTTKLVGITTDTTFLDHLPVTITAQKYYYLLTAVDSTNNQSAPSEEVTVLVTGMNEIPPIVVEEYKLLNNYPNPFNSSTIIPYRLKESGYVKLKVYDIRGELVRLLVNEWQEKGYYEVEFKPTKSERVNDMNWVTGYNDDIATGIYLYQIQVISEGRMPVFISMGKMILLK